MNNTAKALYNILLKEEGWRERFDKKFVIPNGHFHDFYYKEHPYEPELWTNYIRGKGLKKLKAFIQSEMNNLLDRVEKEVIMKDEDTSLKDLNSKEFNMELNQVHRQGRNELRQSQRQKLQELRKELS